MNDKDLPLVTVFTLVYNTGKYVIQALESVRANNYPNLQHILIDDCSFDGESVQLVESWIKKNNYDCIFIKHEKNQGICKSLNEILALVKGKYMLGISDDLLVPDRIRRHVEIFERLSGNYAVVFSDVAWINENNDRIKDSSFEDIRKKFGVVPEGVIYYPLLNTNFIPVVGVTMKASCIKSAGGYDESLFFEDWDMWLRLSQTYQFSKDDRVGGFYRKHSRSVWNTHLVRNYECNVLTLLKNISDSESKKIALPNLLFYAETIYQHRGKMATSLFFKIFQKTHSIKSLIFGLAALIGLPYSFVVRPTEKTT